MPNIQFNDFNSQSAKIEQARRLAAMLQGNAQANEQNTPAEVSGRAVPISPLALIANTLQKGYGAYLNAKASKEEGALKDKQQQALIAALSGEKQPSIADFAQIGATPEQLMKLSIAQKTAQKGLGYLQGYDKNGNPYLINKATGEAMTPISKDTGKPIEGSALYSPDSVFNRSSANTAGKGFVLEDDQNRKQLFSGAQANPQQFGRFSARQTETPEAPNADYAIKGNDQQIKALAADVTANPDKYRNDPDFDSLVKFASDYNKVNNQQPAKSMSLEEELKTKTNEEIRKQKEVSIFKNDLNKDKPLPPAALKLKKDELDIIGASAGVNADLKALRDSIEDGKLNLGLYTNLESKARNFLGQSTPESALYATLNATLQRLRNQSLLLNKGVQTEGDAERAWNELLNNINDEEVVKKRLDEIQATNDRAINLRKMNIDMIHQNYGHGPMDFKQYENQPAAVGQPSSNGWTVEEVE